MTTGYTIHLSRIYVNILWSFSIKNLYLVVYDKIILFREAEFPEHIQGKFVQNAAFGKALVR